MEHPTESVEVYRRYVSERLCWVDGVPTHASSALQRQCPQCRQKWSFERLALELDLLRQYCLGTNASSAARAVECAKNTALNYFQLFSGKMQESVGAMLLDGAIATNPVTLSEVKSLEKALRTGRSKLRERACRHLFFASLSYEERLDGLFRAHIVAAVEEKLQRARRVEADIFMSASPYLSGRRKPMSLWRRIISAISGKWRDLRAHYDPECAYPTKACEKLGGDWVKIWTTARSFRKASPRN